MRDREALKIAWRTVAIVGVILNLGLVAAVVVLAFQHNDGLSTLALTLAIIAFLAQIVIFAFQTTHAGEQLKEARDLNRSTLELISDLRNQVTATHDMVISHNDLLLRRLASEKSGETPPDEPLVSTAATTAEPIRLPLLSDETRDILRMLKTWPPREEVDSSISLLEALPGDAVRYLSLDLASSVLDLFTQKNLGIGLAPGDEPLLGAGLVKEVEPRDGVRQVSLTEKGFEVSRVLTASWPPPDDISHARERLWALREEASVNALQAVSSRFDLTD